MVESQTYCRICPGLCGLVVRIEDNTIVSVRGDKANPATAGYICVKGTQYPEFHHSPDRILSPRRREHDGRYITISSAKALDEIAQAVARIIERHGPDAVAFMSGTAAFNNPLQTLMAQAWREALGTRSLFSTMTIDQSAKWVTDCRLGRFAAGRQSFDGADVWLLAGNNPLVSLSGSIAGVPQYNPLKYLRQAKERGLKLIVVDPRRTETATHLADLFLQIIPGEDPTLFAAMLREIFINDWYDHAFCDRYVNGLEQLKAEVAAFTLDYAAARTGVPAPQIHAAAAMFARDSKRGMAGSGTGPDMSPRGNLTEHLIQCLNVVCGRFVRPGDVLQNPPIMQKRQPVYAEVIAPDRHWEYGHRSRSRDYGTLRGEMMSAILADEILHEGEGSIRALFCVGSNPANSLPDQFKAIRALKALDLLVTSEPRWSETARLAHYVFAPKLHLERPDHSIFMEAWGTTLPYVQYTPALLDPPADSDLVDDWYVYWSLGSKMGLQLQFAGHKLDMNTPPTSDELLELIGSQGEVSYELIKAAHSGRTYELEPVIVQPPRPEASARFDVMPRDVVAELAEVFTESRQTHSASGKFTHLLACRRIRETVNTVGHKFSTIQKRMTTNPVFLHPDDMAELHLAEGDRVRIRSEKEELTAIVASDSDLRRGVASMNHGWGGLPGDGDVSETGVSTSRLVSTDAYLEAINAMPRMSAIPVSFVKDNVREPC